MHEQVIPPLQSVERALDLIPVALKEAALDSPTFRSTTAHFSHQFDIIERWLEDYVKSGTRLAHDVAALESSVNSWLQHTVPPPTVGQAALDFDYTLLAAQKYTKAVSDTWQSTFRIVKRNETQAIESIRLFLNNDLRAFKETKRSVDTTQRVFDHVLARHAGQTRSKEPSSLREGAFQLHEARKAYLKASMDFCVQGAQLRAALDRTLVKAFTDKFRDLRSAREDSASLFRETSPIMDRIRGWAGEIQSSEPAFERDLLAARRGIEDAAEGATRPSRELEDYTDKTATYASSNTPLTQRAEKQGWLFHKTLIGKPTRTVWNRRWVFVKNGILGWLVPGRVSGGVEESEKIGLLLCSVRPATTEERRFCFEVKTKDSTLVFQAEKQAELSQWIDVFEVAKRKALEDPSNAESPTASASVDAAFSISPPIASELAANPSGHAPSASEDVLGPSSDPFVATARNSVDASVPRRSTMLDREEGTGTRDHASRIISKLDLHRKTTPSSAVNPSPSGGIASLISASHGSLPVGPGTGIPVPTPITPEHQRNHIETPSSLTPSTLVNPPAPTNLSRVAISVSGERSISLGNGTGTPSGIMANLWGSEKWGQINRLERGDQKIPVRATSQPTSPRLDDRPGSRTGPLADRLSQPQPSSAGPIQQSIRLDEAWYPPALKKQDAQFRLLFPTVHRSDRVVFVFRATWNPNEHQEFPGRVYVTARELFFYSNHLGFVLITAVGFTSVTEVTAAPGRDCDFLYVHLKDGDGNEGLRRVTIKTFLEPLKLVQRRLNYLVENANAGEPAAPEEIIKRLVEMGMDECGPHDHDDAVDSEADYGVGGVGRGEHDVRRSLRIDDKLGGGDPVGRTGRQVNRFKLPERAVSYTPQGMEGEPVTGDFGTSARALFHIMFGDKSAVFQTICLGHGAKRVTQQPWKQSPSGLRRSMDWQMRRQRQQHEIRDVQTVDVQKDHLCYVVTETPSTWNFPHPERVKLIVKYIITHSARSRCRLAIYRKLVWQGAVVRGRTTGLIERRALRDLEHDARNVMQVVREQVGWLGSKHTTNRAMQIYGPVGQSTDALVMTHESAQGVPAMERRVVVYTVAGLWWREAVGHVSGVLAFCFDVANAIIKCIGSTVDGHRILAGLLTVSIVCNLSYGLAGGRGWQQERSAARYMSKLGVGGDKMLSAGIYLRDLDQLGTMRNSTESVETTSSRCRDKFRIASDARSSHWSAMRERLAQRRYQMLLGLRVINRIDEEVGQSQWGDWVRGEVKRCDRASRLLGAGRRDADTGAAGVEVGIELEEYCKSCRDESASIRDDTLLG